MDPKFSQDLYTANITENAAEGVVLIFFSLMSGSEKRSLATPVSFPGVVGGYHWQELLQVPFFLSRQKHVFCHNKCNRDKRHVLSRQTHVCRNKSKLFATKRLSRQNCVCRNKYYFYIYKTFVASNIILSRQKTCLSRQNYTWGSSCQ